MLNEKKKSQTTNRIFGGRRAGRTRVLQPYLTPAHAGTMGNNAGKPGEPDAYVGALEKGGKDATPTTARDKLAAQQWLTTEARGEEVTVSWMM